MIDLTQISALRKANLTLDRLAILVSAVEPMTTRELAKKAGVSEKLIQRFIVDSKGLLKTVKYKGERTGQSGRPPQIAFVRTAKAEKLLAK